jgi:hypothetical protein
VIAENVRWLSGQSVYVLATMGGLLHMYRKMRHVFVVMAVAAGLLLVGITPAYAHDHDDVEEILDDVDEIIDEVVEDILHDLDLEDILKQD